MVKEILHANGCDLPFYDFLDSYAEEFERTITEAKRTCPSLAGVHEVEDSVYRRPDWSALGHGDLQPMKLKTDDEIGDYTSHSGFGKANLCGLMTMFRDPSGALKTVVFVRKTLKDFEHKENKYAMKIIALHHEIGHVHDIEHGLNFDLQNGRVNVLDAEVYANRYALDQLADRQLVQGYAMLADALRKASTQADFLGEVARKVLQDLPEHKLVAWQDYMPNWNSN
jgi:hypothetical protein